MNPRGPDEGGSLPEGDGNGSGLTHLAMASTELSARMGLHEVVTSVLDLAVGLNGSTHAAVMLLEDTGAVSGRIIRYGSRETSQYATTSEMTKGALRDCLESGLGSWHVRPAVEPPASDMQTRRTPRVTELRAEEILSDVSVAIAHPVKDPTGEVLGAVAIGWERPPEDSPSVRATTELFCELAEASISRAMRTEELSGLADQLREALLPAGNSHVELDVAFDYVPALNTIGFGGDWFDFVDRSDHSVVLVVGDVAGHGVSAAAQMALIQGAVRGLALRSSVDELPALASRALTGGRAEFVATLGVLKVDLAEMTVSCWLAGHPPPMLRHPGGAVQQLGDEPAPPIGMVSEPMAPTAVHGLEDGCLLVLYSDGLIERRGTDLDERLAMLESVVAGLDDGADAQSCLETICEEMLTDASEDDVAILVARVDRGRTAPD